MEVENTIPDFLQIQWDRRAELIALSKACQHLSEQLSIEPPDELNREARLESLSQPIKLALIGDSGVGKSALLAELTGLAIFEELSRGGWVRRPGAKEKSGSEFENRQLDAPILKSLECFESPSLSVDEQPWEQGIIDAADLLLLLFSADNPWSAPTWNWFERHVKAHSGKIVIVLTHADCFEAVELNTIEKHMREIASQRCGYVYPISVVGGADSIRSLHRDLEWKLGRLPSLRDRVDDVLVMIDDHQSKIERVLERRARILREDGGFLEELEQEISEIQSAELRRIESEVNEGFRSFLDAGAKILVFLKDELSVLKRWRALLIGDGLALRFERKFQQLAAERMELWAKKGFERHLSRLRNHWEEVQPRSQKQLRLALAPFPEAELSLLEEHRKDVILDAVRKSLLQVRMRDVLTAELQPYRQMILSWFTLGLLFWVSGAFAGIAGSLLGAGVLLGLSVFSLIVSAFRVASAGEQIRSHMSRRIKSLGPDISACLEPVGRAEVLALFAKYRSCFGQVNEHISRSREELLPAQERWRAVYLSLKAMQQDR